jgi:hypothetical protein
MDEGKSTQKKEQWVRENFGEGVTKRRGDIQITTWAAVPEKSVRWLSIKRQGQVLHSHEIVDIPSSAEEGLREIFWKDQEQRLRHSAQKQAEKEKARISREAEILARRPYCKRYKNVESCPKFHRDDRGDCRYDNGALNVISPKNAIRTRSLAGEPAWCSRPCLQSDPYNAARAQSYCCAPIDEPPSSQCPKFSSR